MAWTKENFQGENGYLVVTWNPLAKKWMFRPVSGGQRLTGDEINDLFGYVQPEGAKWVLPTGTDQFPYEDWYAASRHSLDGKLNNGYRHSGWDINLDVAPYGDIERELGLKVYASSYGEVTHVNPDWYGNAMVVVRQMTLWRPVWVRYAHIVPIVGVGTIVTPGAELGAFADWRTGDHLHYDMAWDKITDEWLTPSIRWADPWDVHMMYQPEEVLVEYMARK